MFVHPVFIPINHISVRPCFGFASVKSHNNASLPPFEVYFNASMIVIMYFLSAGLPFESVGYNIVILAHKKNKIHNAMKYYSAPGFTQNFLDKQPNVKKL